MDILGFCHERGLLATQKLAREEQKEWGQFMTPPAIARVMAARATTGIASKKIVQILEPAAGVGILAAAAVESLLQQEERPAQIYLQMFELDERLQPTLKSLASRLRKEGERRGVSIHISIQIEDFLLSKVASEKPQFDLVIANPPYFKLNKKDPRVSRHEYAVYGQPNIYGLFMAACSRVLHPGGRWCFITPRSWTNGLYFSMTRRKMLVHLHIDAMHVFESRQEHFTDDEVLQEAMITWATAQSNRTSPIILSTSTGIRDLEQSALQALPVCQVIRNDDQNTIALPTHLKVEETHEFEATLATYDLKVSTGPVVAFRSEGHLSELRRRNSVPLLWLQHVQHMQISWPIHKKREHIAANAKSAWMLVPNANMVILRRFSPKEDSRRITAAPYIADTLPGKVLGLENHVNYIYRPGGHMSRDETVGLAAFLNSLYVDTYLRQISGNTQVNAADLRNLPLPSLQQLVAIGRKLNNSSTLVQADAAVASVLQQQAEVAIA